MAWAKARWDWDIKTCKLHHAFTSALPFVLLVSVANFYTLQGYEAWHCQTSRKLPNLEPLSACKRISFTFWKNQVSNRTCRESASDGDRTIPYSHLKSEVRACSSVSLYLPFLSYGCMFTAHAVHAPVSLQTLTIYCTESDHPQLSQGVEGLPLVRIWIVMFVCVMCRMYV